MEKVRHMVEGTRHVKRSATVTETFDAVTPRMLKAANSGNGNGGELVTLGGGTKASSAAVNVVAGLKTRQKEVGFQVLVGAAQTLEPSLQAGSSGCDSRLRRCRPDRVLRRFMLRWKEGDLELSRLKQSRIDNASMRIVSGLGIAGMKYAMDFNGYFGGPVRLPLLPLTIDLKDGGRAIDGRHTQLIPSASELSRSSSRCRL